jgi:hypothetical protein
MQSGVPAKDLMTYLENATLSEHESLVGGFLLVGIPFDKYNVRLAID